MLPDRRQAYPSAISRSTGGARRAPGVFRTAIASAVLLASLRTSDSTSGHTLSSGKRRSPSRASRAASSYLPRSR